MGGGPEHDYFVDGVAESLTTNLSRMSGMLVIGHTAFTYKGKAVDLKQIGRELNVRYVLEGSVQRAGNRIRVNVQLIDAESGNHLWAERFDKPLADLFDMQDEIVSRLANQLGAELSPQAQRAERTPNPELMTCTFRVWLGSIRDTVRTSDASAQLLRTRIDAGSRRCRRAGRDGAGRRGLAGAFMTDDRAARLAAAKATVTKALSLAPSNALAHSRWASS